MHVALDAGEDASLAPAACDKLIPEMTLEGNFVKHLGQNRFSLPDFSFEAANPNLFVKLKRYCSFAVDTDYMVLEPKRGRKARNGKPERLTRKDASTRRGGMVGAKDGRLHPTM
jgi:hypothetical protein